MIEDKSAVAKIKRRVNNGKRFNQVVKEISFLREERDCLKIDKMALIQAIKIISIGV